MCPERVARLLVAILWIGTPFSNRALDDLALGRSASAQSFVTLARLGVARISGVTKMIAARGACMTFAGFHRHRPLGTVRKALELDRSKCRLTDQNG